MHHIDSVLFGRGGIPRGVIVDVFGRHGTGKTQMLLQAASRFAACGKQVLYVDTAGTFRPERVVSMAEASALGGTDSDGMDTNSSNSDGGMTQDSGITAPDVLKMISVARIQSVAEQLSVLERLSGCLRRDSDNDNDDDDNNNNDYDSTWRYNDLAPYGQNSSNNKTTDAFDLVIIDGLTDLFSYEYSRYGDLRERNSIFFWYMRGLARLAVCGNITIMVSNMVRTSPKDKLDSEIMAAEARLFSHARIHLQRNDDPSAKKRFWACASCIMQDIQQQQSQHDTRGNTHTDTHNIGAGSGLHDSAGGFTVDAQTKYCDVEFTYKITSMGITTK